MARKKKTEAVDKVQEEPQQKAPKKHDYIIAVTEDEYGAHREEIDKLDNVIFFVDDADRRLWMSSQWRLGGIDLDQDV